MYTISNLTSQALPFLLLPVLTRFMSPTDYGIVAMFLLAAVVLEPVIGVNLAGAMTVKYYDPTTNLPRYLGTGLILASAIGLLAFGVLWLLGGFLADVTQVPFPWLMLAVPLVLSRTVASSFLAILRVRQRAISYGAAQNLQTLADLGLSLLLVVGLRLTWGGRVAAEVIGWVGFAMVALLLMARSGWISRSFHVPYARHIVAFGVPLIPHTLGAALMVQTDRLLITDLVGLDQTGLYVVAFQLTMVIELVAASFNNAYTPWLFERLSRINREMTLRLVRYTYMQFAVMAAFALVVAMVLPAVAGVLLGRSFAASGQFVGWLALGFLFSGMYYMVANYIFFAQRTAWLAAVTISVAILNIPITYALISLNGAVGAAQASAIAFGLSFLGTWVVSQRAYPMPWLQVFRRDPGTVDQ